MVQPHDSVKRGSGRLADVCDAVVSVLFPAGCRLCEGLLTRASRVPICDACLASFEPLQGRTCEICDATFQASFGAAWLDTEDESSAESDRRICRVCTSRPYAFERALSYSQHQEARVRAIVILKFERIEPLGKWFAYRLAELVKGEPEMLQADVVVPVPTHHQRLRERGYNQADLLGKRFARLLGLPYRAVLLIRTRPRPDKHILSSRERWESVRGAFATRPGSQVDNLRVLLVDDVMTTGAMLEACSKGASSCRSQVGSSSYGGPGSAASSDGFRVGGSRGSDERATSGIARFPGASQPPSLRCFCVEFEFRQSRRQ